MVKNMNPASGDKGLAPRHLVLLFLAGIAVCGVFFSLGFLVGFNERSAQAGPATERVSTPAAIPPAVNAPPDTTQIVSNGPGGASAVPPSAAQQQSGVSTLPSEGESPESAPAKTPPPAAAAPPPPAAQKRPASAAAGETGVGFTVQVTASRTKQDAEALVKVLKGRDYPVFMLTPEYAHANDNLYRVQVGPFKSKEDADKVRAKLTKEGFKPFVKH